MVRFSGVLVVALAALGPHAVAAEAASSNGGPLDAGTGFRLESRPAIDDVFGDASDYRRTIDRFLELTTSMQTMRDEFARSVQSTLQQLGKNEGGRKRACPDGVAGPYARAHKLGADYLRIGRELTRHYEVVKEFDRLGESIGLTPDYRWKVKRVLAQFTSLLTDYREMKVAFHDQLNDELKYAGCELQSLLLKGDPSSKAPSPVDESWPQPGQPGAPGVLTKVDGKEPGPPSSLPSEKVPPASPIAMPKRPVVAPTTAPADKDSTPRSGVLFYVDNSKCQRGTTVFLDGKRIGDVPAATRVGFQTFPGPHDLCLIDDNKKQCGAPGTVRRSYLHEGWTISLRCE
jgi:hypothetical protein